MKQLGELCHDLSGKLAVQPSASNNKAAWTEENCLPLAERPKKNSGGFFAVHAENFYRACALGMNEACAYAVLACYTGRENRISSAGKKAIKEYAGLGYDNAAKAIKNLIEKGIIVQEQGGMKPRYALHKGNQLNEGYIWLPNEIIRGAGGETPPLILLRQTGDVNNLLIFIWLYSQQNIADFGGVSPAILFQEYVHEKIGDYAGVVLWHFTQTQVKSDFLYYTVNGWPKGLDGKSAAHAMTLLVELGLLTASSYLYESDKRDAEMITACDLNSEYPQVQKICAAIKETSFDIASRRFLDAVNFVAETGDDQILVAVPKHYKKVCMKGIFRLRYRPKTSLTAAGMARDIERAEAFHAVIRKAAGLGLPLPF